MAWFADWFNTKYYHILYKDRDFEEAEIFIRKLTDFLQLPKGSSVIDLACGKGRHSIFLNKLGYNVLGLDLSEESILHDQQFEASTPLSLTSLKFAVHDMRDEIFGRITDQKFDAVFNLFTSFGYFDDEDDDRKVFKSVADVLKDDGYFVLDFLNEKFVKNTLVPEYDVNKEGIDFHITKRIENNAVIKNIYFKDKGKNYHFYEKVNLHTLEKIDEYAREVGLERVKVFGDYLLSDFDLETSPRAINVFKKNK